MSLSFDVIKGGVVVDTIVLFDDKAPLQQTLTIGRDQDTCDLPFLHGSISRKHAELIIEVTAERKLSFVKLKDLNSSNGTFVNKKRFQGVKNLNVGDLVSFGESTRLYLLCCTLEVAAPVTLINVEKELKGSQKDSPSAPKATKLVDRKPTAREKKLLQRVKDKEDKIAKIELENQRIQAKEQSQGELTEGQTNQLDKNLARLEVLQEEIVNLKDELENESDRLDSKAKQEIKKKQRKLGRSQDSDDDEFYDRTKKNKPTPKAVVIETEQTLTTKIEALSKQRQAVVAAVEDLKAQNEGAKTNTEEDALEQFMASNNEGVRQKELKAKQDKLHSLDVELAKLNALLVIARPAISSLSSKPKPKQFAMPATVAKPQASTTKPELNEEEVASVAPAKGEKRKSGFIAPSELKKQRALVERDMKEKKQEEAEEMFVPPPNQTGDGSTRLNAKYGY